VEGNPGVLRIGLTSAHLRVITDHGIQEEDLKHTLQVKGCAVFTISPTDPTSEDVFLALVNQS
jgi:hypothetical protein